MNHLKSIIAVLVFTLIFSFSQAQDKIKLENSVLWKIEHSELKEPSYVLGTLHMMCKNDFEISKKITQTLQNVDALVLEVNLSDKEEMKSMQETMKNPKKISEELTKEQFEELDTLITKIMGISLTNFDTYGLSILSAIMIQKMLPCTEIKSLDNELMLLAAEKQKPIYSLEKISEQMEILKQAYPTEFALKQILLFDSYKKDFIEAITAYKNEDIKTAVSLITKDIYMNENATNLMQINRNKNWVDKMPQMMKERSNLFAIGTAHLTNKHGVINLLRQIGYTVTPVFN
ncbi:TraB/GumN family protein [Flavobacteriaceae bacterium]|nr:TraB/GumN family protein [Flavobacteriaceae bacterium]